MLRLAAAVLLVALVPALSPLAAAEEPADAPVPTGDYLRTLDIAFPVSGRSSYGDDYHQNRGGGSRRHQATDVMAPKLAGLHAAVEGRICHVNGVDEPMPSWGYSLTLCGDDGLRYRYIHINNDSPGTDDGLGGPTWAYAPGIRRGVRVARGQWLGYVGDSGNAEGTAPHLHFEVHEENTFDPRLDVAPYQQGRLNPYPSLAAARARGEVPAPPQLRHAPSLRLHGPTRVDTALAISGTRLRAPAVVVVPARSHAEALVAAPLAAGLDAPVLLADPAGMGAPAVAEVRRLGAGHAVLVGRPDQLGPQVEVDLRAAGVGTLERIAAADPYALSALVAVRLAAGERAERVFLAAGEAGDPSRAWPDALSASALAAHLRAPILLTPPGGLPAAVTDVLAALRPRRVDVVGGSAAVPDAVAQAAAAAARGRVERLAGPDRYATSARVAAAGVAAGLDRGVVWVATGRDFPDALAAGPAAARDRSPLLLVDGSRVRGAPHAEVWLHGEALRVERTVVVGGEAAVGRAVQADLGRILARS